MRASVFIYVSPSCSVDIATPSHHLPRSTAAGSACASLAGNRLVIEKLPMARQGFRIPPPSLQSGVVKPCWKKSEPRLPPPSSLTVP